MGKNRPGGIDFAIQRFGVLSATLMMRIG